MSVPFTTVFQLSLQHFVYLVVLRGNVAALIALRPSATAGWGRRNRFRIEIVFGIHIGSLAARLWRPLFARTTFIPLTATPATTATTARATILAPFAIAGRSAANGFFVNGLLIVEGLRSGQKVVVGKRLAARIDIAGVYIARTNAAGWLVTGVDVARIDITRVNVRLAALVVRPFFRATTTSATPAATATRIATFFVGRAIEAEPFLGCGNFSLASDEIFGFKRFSSWFRMRFWRPVFDEAFAETSPRRAFFAPRRAALFVPPAASVSILVAITARTAVAMIPPLIATTTTIPIATAALTSLAISMRSS